MSFGIAALGVACFVIGVIVGVCALQETMYHFVKTDGTYKFKWKGKRLCVRGNRK